MKMIPRVVFLLLFIGCVAAAGCSSRPSPETKVDENAEQTAEPKTELKEGEITFK